MSADRARERNATRIKAVVIKAHEMGVIKSGDTYAASVTSSTGTNAQAKKNKDMWRRECKQCRLVVVAKSLLWMQTCIHKGHFKRVEEACVALLSALEQDGVIDGENDEEREMRIAPLRLPVENFFA